MNNEKNIRYLQTRRISYSRAFSTQEGVFGFGSRVEQATPTRTFIMLNTISGYYQSPEITDIFFMKNGKLVFERKLSGFLGGYFYNSGMDMLP